MKLRDMRFSVLVGAIFVVLPLLSRAESVTLFGKTINLVTPTGFCQVDEKRPREAEIFGRIRFGVGPRATLVAVYGKCDEVQALREVRSAYADGFKDYVTISLTTPSSEVKILDGVTRERFVSSAVRQLNSEGGKEEANAGLKRAEARLKAADRENKEPMNFGVLDSDKNAVYVGLVGEQVKASDTGISRVLTVGAITLVQGLQTSIGRTRLSSQMNDLQIMVADQKRLLAQFAAQNP